MYSYLYKSSGTSTTLASPHIPIRVRDTKLCKLRLLFLFAKITTEFTTIVVININTGQKIPIASDYLTSTIRPFYFRSIKLSTNNNPVPTFYAFHQPPE